MRRALRNPRILIGTVFLLFLCIIAVFAKQIAPFNPIKMYPSESLQAPSIRHLFGTDMMGRDVFSRIIYGARYSLLLGCAAVTISAILGTLLGLTSGYFGGRLDSIIMRIVDIGLAFPSVLLALLIIAILGPGLTSVTIAIGISATPPFARLIRGCVLAIKETPFVEAARAIGANRWRIVFRHVLPEVFAPAITMATLRLAGAIFSASSLSFLGFGAQPPTPEWGAIVSAARHMLRAAWWISTFGGLAIMLTVLAINVLGDGLRDVLDPKLRGKI
ncbi:ABC transporter permease [Candidatus Bipolaricaulota bacterium]